MLRFLKQLVLKLIELVEKIELSNTNLDIVEKILESRDLSNIDVWTDSGWQPASHIHITKPFDIWKIKTPSGKFLECADEHLVFDKNYKQICVDKLRVDDIIQTIDGPEKIVSIEKSNTKVCMFDMTVDHPDHRYYTNGILSHNTVMTGIFVAWYVIFNIDKNAMILANKGATAAEIVDKIKTVIKGLPFFLKPGVVQNNVMTMKFDNGCRIMSQSTTKTAAIGFTIHLLFMDEFAHIHNNFIEPFYRSVYPTLSSSQISRVIITSTANGRNKFWEIYTNALKKPGEEGKNEYSALRVDWWEVPGRDERWKAQEIANLGSEELFNQEYGNQFTAADTLLLTSNSLQYLRKIVKKYKHKEIEDFEFTEIDYKDLKWHPKFNIDSISDSDRFFISIDLADGIGRDYTVFNIFKVEEMSGASIRNLRKDRIEDERSFYRLVQVGLFRSNRISIEDAAVIADILLFKVFKPEHIKVALEMNFKGDYFLEKLRKNDDFFEDIFIHTRHRENAAYSSMGIKLHKHNKMLYCRELRKLVLEKRVVLTEEDSYNEMSAFGINNKGSYSSQAGADDIAMTTVYCSTVLTSEEFSYLIEDIIDSSSDKFKEEMFSAIEKTGDGETGEYSYVQEFM